MITPPGMAAAYIDADVLESGCCGMVGSFGFEARHYDASTACAERILRPAVPAADPNPLLVADGFSYRQRVRQNLGRGPAHLAEVLADALSARSEGAGAR